MPESRQPVPAIRLPRANARGDLLRALRQGADLDGLMHRPIPGTAVFPVEWPPAMSTGGAGCVVEFSARGVDRQAYFVHLILDTASSVRSTISVSQGGVAAPRASTNFLGGRTGYGGSVAPDWRADEWVRWWMEFAPYGVTFCAAAHERLEGPFCGSCRMQLVDAPLRVEAIVLGTSDLDTLSIADVRFWDHELFTLPEDQILLLGGRRLDGREPPLLGYWKLADGEGDRLVDSSRFGNDGMVSGGAWLAAGESNLRLDCSLESVREAREDVRRLAESMRAIDKDRAGVAQIRTLLQDRAGQIATAQAALDERTREVDAELENETRALEQALAEWNALIEDGGKVGLDEFSATVAGEVQAASEALVAARSPYRLQRVELDVKLLPTQRAEGEDFVVSFPQPEDADVEPGQLSTVRLDFAPRPPSPPRVKRAVPDVRGHTESMARRLLAAAGFKLAVLEQATDAPAEVDRVVGQEPPPGTECGLNTTLLLLIGRASGRGATG